MAGNNTAVFGICSTRLAVEEAVDHLRNAGFRNTDISVLFPENVGTKDFAHEKNTKAPEGATTAGVSHDVPAGLPGADRRHAGRTSSNDSGIGPIWAQRTNHGALPAVWRRRQAQPLTIG